MSKTYRVTSSLGHYIIDENGEVLTHSLSLEADDDYLNVTKFDVDDWLAWERKHWSDETPDDVDILHITGVYNQADVDEYRAETIARLEEDDLPPAHPFHKNKTKGIQTHAN